MLRNISFTTLMIMSLILTLPANAAVRWNPYYNIWEGNICMNNYGWQIVNWQPLGTVCMIQLPGRPMMQGLIINA